MLEKMIMEVVGLVVSIIALVISVVAIVVEAKGNKKINDTNLEAVFVEKVFFDRLLFELPKARNSLTINNNIISNTEGLIDLLNDIRRDSLFFQFNDEMFYTRLKKSLQTLEDELVRYSDIKLNIQEFGHLIDRINKMIGDIYREVYDKYLSKNDGGKT